MNVTIVPTLAVMAGIYATSAAGGPSSERFRAYERHGKAGTPIAGYNPMTSKPVGATVERLLALDAEAVAARAATAAAGRLGWTGDLALHLTVATPGMWTEHRATKVDYHLLPKHRHEILLWFDGDDDEASVAAAATCSAHRAIWWERHRGAEPTLAELCRREGAAYADAGWPGRWSARADQALEVLGGDPSRASAVAFLWGDDWAGQLGHSPIGLDRDEGLDHAIAISRR